MVGVKAVYETPLDIFFVTELVGGGMLEWVVWWCLMFPPWQRLRIGFVSACGAGKLWWQCHSFFFWGV